MLDKLKEKNIKLIEEYHDDNFHDKEYRQKIIKAMLAEDGCFFKMDMEVAYNILEDLGYNKEEIKKIYSSLTSAEEYQKYMEGN